MNIKGGRKGGIIQDDELVRGDLRKGEGGSTNISSVEI